MINSTQSSDNAALFASINASASAGTAKASTAATTQDRFLKLLVTQMKNQDPLNPMDNAQVTSQMAQLSTVTGIDKLNATLQALSDSVSSGQTLQAATMIGHGVLVPGKIVELSGGRGYGGVELAQSVGQLNVEIYDQAGALVRKIGLGAQSAGLVNWQWDGRNEQGAAVADGSYVFKVAATQDGKSVDSTALQFGMVSSVMQGKQGATLTVGNMEGVALSQVRQIL